jgi:hypothetical protein
MDLRGHGLSGDGPWEWEAVAGGHNMVAGRPEQVAQAVLGFRDGTRRGPR